MSRIDQPIDLLSSDDDSDDEIEVLGVKESTKPRKNVSEDDDDEVMEIEIVGPRPMQQNRSKETITTSSSSHTSPLNQQQANNAHSPASSSPSPWKPAMAKANKPHSAPAAVPSFSDKETALAFLKAKKKGETMASAVQSSFGKVPKQNGINSRSTSSSGRVPKQKNATHNSLTKPSRKRELPTPKPTMMLAAAQKSSNKGAPALGKSLMNGFAQKNSSFPPIEYEIGSKEAPMEIDDTPVQPSSSDSGDNDDVDDRKPAAQTNGDKRRLEDVTTTTKQIVAAPRARFGPQRATGSGKVGDAIDLCFSSDSDDDDDSDDEVVEVTRESIQEKERREREELADALRKRCETNTTDEPLRQSQKHRVGREDFREYRARMASQAPSAHHGRIVPQRRHPPSPPRKVQPSASVPTTLRLAPRQGKSARALQKKKEPVGPKSILRNKPFLSGLPSVRTEDDDDDRKEAPVARPEAPGLEPQQDVGGLPRQQALDKNGIANDAFTKRAGASLPSSAVASHKPESDGMLVSESSKQQERKESDATVSLVASELLPDSLSVKSLDDSLSVSSAGGATVSMQDDGMTVKSFEGSLSVNSDGGGTVSMQDEYGSMAFSDSSALASTINRNVGVVKKEDTAPTEKIGVLAKSEEQELMISDHIFHDGIAPSGLKEVPEKHVVAAAAAVDDNVEEEEVELPPWMIQIDHLSRKTIDQETGLPRYEFSVYGGDDCTCGHV